MAWVRRVRTASGATAVQIAESVAGRRRIVRHVGSARDDGELGLLIAEANRLLARDAQHELDLGPPSRPPPRLSTWWCGPWTPKASDRHDGSPGGSRP